MLLLLLPMLVWEAWVLLMGGALVQSCQQVLDEQGCRPVASVIPAAEPDRANRFAFHKYSPLSSALLKRLPCSSLSTAEHRNTTSLWLVPRLFSSPSQDVGRRMAHKLILTSQGACLLPSQPETSISSC